MAKETITIPLETYNVLRGTFIKAIEVLDSLGAIGSVKPPKAAPRQTRKQGIDKYKNLISSGERVKKPDHLKK